MLSMPLEPVLPNGADLGDGREVPIAVDEERVMLAGYFRDATVNGTPDGVTAPPEYTRTAIGSRDSTQGARFVQSVASARIRWISRRQGIPCVPTRFWTQY